MSKKTNGVNWKKDSKTKERRNRAIDRLESQLKSGVRTAKSHEVKEHKSSYGMVIKTINHTDHDTARISRELETLKTRI